MSGAEFCKWWEAQGFDKKQPEVDEFLRNIYADSRRLQTIQEYRLELAPRQGFWNILRDDEASGCSVGTACHRQLRPAIDIAVQEYDRNFGKRRLPPAVLVEPKEAMTAPPRAQ